MYLSNVKLWNFRKFGSDGAVDLDTPDLSVHFAPGLNVLIGENDSGKTAIIDAIKLVLKTHSYEWIRLEQEDYYEDSTRLRIECRFDDFTDEEAKNFTEWLGMEGEGEAAKPYLRVILDASRTTDRILPFDIRAGVDPEGYVINAEAREYLKTTFLKPLRDAKTELVPRKNSRLSQILMGHPVFKEEASDHELVTMFAELGEDIENYFQDATMDGKKVSDALGNFLKKFFGKPRDANFSVSEQKLKNILETLKLTLEDEKLGLGSHNLLFIAAELLNLEREDWCGLRLGLIEEIEAHLHPQAQLRVIEYLQAQDDIQMILTTHSPNLGSKVKLDKLIICLDDNVFPMGSDYTELAYQDYKFLERFLDVTKANLFFATGVILVEGWGEELLLPALAKKIDIDLTERGISIVNLGNTAFLRYSKIFQRRNDEEIGVPVAVITDVDVKPDQYKDVKPDATTEEDVDLAGKISERESRFDGQKVKTFVSPHWTLEYCIGLSPKMRKHLFEAIKLAAEEMGKRITETWEELENGKDQAQLAFYLYHELIVKKEISKAIIAQQLALILETTAIDAIREDASITYLFNAIDYAAG